MTQRFDVILKGGIVVNQDGEGVRDIGIANGRMAEIGAMRAQLLPRAIGVSEGRRGKMAFGEPDLGAIRQMMRLQEREAGLLGLDMPAEEPSRA